MSDLTKVRLLRFGALACLLYTISSIPLGIIYGDSFVISMTLGMIASFACLLLLTQIEPRLPRKPPVRPLTLGIEPAPSFDSVTIPSNSELLRSSVIMLPIVGVPVLCFGYYWGTAISYKEWFPAIIVALILLYIHESINGPHRRWWIGHIFGEWSHQPWSAKMTATINYPFDAFKYDDPVTKRAYSFFGRSLFCRYWLELYDQTTGLVGYLNVNRSLYEKVTGDQIKELHVEIRFSRLHPKRIQLRLA